MFQTNTAIIIGSVIIAAAIIIPRYIDGQDNRNGPYSFSVYPGVGIFRANIKTGQIEVCAAVDKGFKCLLVAQSTDDALLTREIKNALKDIEKQTK